MTITASTKRPADPIERVKYWMEGIIWPQIRTMLLDDAFVMLLARAQQLTGALQGPLGVMIMTAYVTTQTIAIRRLCDARRTSVSLRRIVQLLKTEKSISNQQFTELWAKLDSCKHVCDMASAYVAHREDESTGEPGRGWHLLAGQLTDARRALCEVAIAIDRDILQRLNLVKLIPVPQFDIMQEFRLWVPADQIPELWTFWHAHNDQVNAWIA